MLLELTPLTVGKIAIILICVKKHSRNQHMNLNRNFRNICVDLINRPNGSREILLSKGTENILEIEYDQGERRADVLNLT